VRKDLFVYLSGPITAKHGRMAEENVTAGLRMHLTLVNTGIPNVCPQLTGAFPSAWTVVEYDRWMAYDYAVIDRCTHVLMLEGWEGSTGAQLEKAYAERKGIPVVYSVSDLLRPEAA